MVSTEASELPSPKSTLYRPGRPPMVKWTASGAVPVTRDAVNPMSLRLRHGANSKRGRYCDCSKLHPNCHHGGPRPTAGMTGAVTVSAPLKRL